MSRDGWAAIAVLALAVLGASGWLATHDVLVEHEWTGPAAAAQRDRYLAARRWAARMGIASDELRALEQADTLPAGTLLLVPARRGALSPRALDATRAFVEGGGHLLVESERFERADPLLDAFGIARLAADNGFVDIPGFRDDRNLPPLQSNPADGAGVLAATLGADGEVLRVFLHGGESLDAAGTSWRVGADGNVQALHLERGRGRITAIADSRFARNGQIGRDDNAEFLWRLLRLDPDADRLVIHRGARPRLGAWLAQHAQPVLVAFGLLVGLGLWHVAPRFGPLLPEPEPARRRLLDHLGASGRYFWSVGRRAALAQAASRSALAALRRQFPHVALLDDAECAAFLATRLGMAPALALRVVDPGAVRTAPALVELVQACARIHAAVDAGGRAPARVSPRTDPSRKTHA